MAQARTQKGAIWDNELTMPPKQLSKYMSTIGKMAKGKTSDRKKASSKANAEKARAAKSKNRPQFLEQLIQSLSV